MNTNGDDQGTEGVGGVDEIASPRRGFGPWRLAMVGLSVVLMVVGVGSAFLVGPAASESEAARTGEPGAPAGVGDSGLLLGLDAVDGSSEPPSAPGEATTGGPDAENGWPPLIFRMGFSFFLGFSIAYALRTFLKISVVACGLMFLALFGLQYAGIVEVNWTVMEGHYDTVSDWLRSQTAGVPEFVKGYIPSAALAGLGFVMGFRKR